MILHITINLHILEFLINRNSDSFHALLLSPAPSQKKIGMYVAVFILHFIGQ